MYASVNPHLQPLTSWSEVCRRMPAVPPDPRGDLGVLHADSAQSNIKIGFPMVELVYENTLSIPSMI
jgi:hypothetical protein